MRRLLAMLVAAAFVATSASGALGTSYPALEAQCCRVSFMGPMKTAALQEQRLDIEPPVVTQKSSAPSDRNVSASCTEIGRLMNSPVGVGCRNHFW
jgi:hypothetical protein